MPEGRLAYLRAHRTRADAVYVNTIGRTVEQIRQEAQLRDAIESFLDAHANGWAGRDPQGVRAEIQQFVRNEASLDWALDPPRPLGLLHRLSAGGSPDRSPPHRPSPSAGADDRAAGLRGAHPNP